MQVRVDLKIFIFIIIFFITGQIRIYGILMLFALLHECGHLVVGMLLGFKIQKFNINSLGLAINFKVNVLGFKKKIKKANIICIKKLLIALAGPVVNFVFAIIFFKTECCNWINNREEVVYANFLIGIFNLIPIYPLDGGRILKEILHIFCGLEKSYTYINKISNASIILVTMCSSILILYFKNISILFIIGYLWYIVINQNKIFSQKAKIYEMAKKYSMDETLKIENKYSNSKFTVK